MVPGMEIFFRRLGEAFCADGVFRLTFIEVGGQLAAGTIGFVWGGTSYLYNSAFDRIVGDPRPRHGARRRGHPPRDRGGLAASTC